MAIPITDFVFKIDTPEGVTYEPWTDGWAVGFKCEHEDGRTEYIYLNPSGEDDEGKQATCFLYHGEAGDPAQDGTVVFVNILEPTAKENS